MIGAMAGGKQFTMQIIEELKLAKRDAEAEARLNELYSSAKSAAELSGAMSVMLQQEELEQLPEFFQRWQVAAREEIAKPAPLGSKASQQARPILAGMSNTLMQWIGRLGPDEENAQILSILDQVLDIATIEGKQRQIALAAQAAKARRSSTATASQNQASMSWIYGKENQYIQVTWPSKNLDSSVARLLRDVHEVLKRNDVLPDLITRLKDRAKAASPEDVQFANLYLATELWWADEQDEAVEILVQLGEAQKNDPNARFELAELRSQRGDIEDALEIVDSVVARDQQLLQRR